MWFFARTKSSARYQYGGIPRETVVEAKRRAWSGVPPAYRITAPSDQRQQWLPLQITPKRPQA